MNLLEIAQLLWDKQSTDCLAGQTLFVQHVEGQISPQSEVVFNAEPGYMQVCEAEWLLEVMAECKSGSTENIVKVLCEDVNAISKLVDIAVESIKLYASK